MKKIFPSILFLSVVICISFSCESKPHRNKKLSNIVDSAFPDIYNEGNKNKSKGRITHNSLRDSIYEGGLSNTSEDTIIHGVRYAYAVIYSGNHILAWCERCREYGNYQYMKLITNGISSTTSDRPNNEPELYYDSMQSSPSRRYVFFCEYYTTWDIKLLEKDVQKEILRFGRGIIFDIAKGEKVMDLDSGEVSGYWTYCDQWVSDDEVIFNPEKRD